MPPASHRLAHKIVVVTGAAQGIGFAIAKQCILEDASVVVAMDLNLSVLEETVHTLNALAESSKLEGRVYGMQVDISDESSVKKVFEDLPSKCNVDRIDVLVNNAACFVFGEIDTVSTEEWKRILDVNVIGTALCTRYAIPLLTNIGSLDSSDRCDTPVAVDSPDHADKDRSIVNIGSISSWIAQRAFIPYNTSKGAILQMTRCAALDLGRKYTQVRVRVNMVAPGPVDTPAFAKDAELKGLTKRELELSMSSQMILDRVAQPEEIAHAVVFLASPYASYITGASLAVDGGYTTL